jgi:archaetidylinositol phosphate synthase
MLKTKFPDVTNKISRKIGSVFSRMHLPPTAWTFLSIIPAIIGFYFLVYNRDMFLGFIFFFISGFFDAIDGAVARVTKSVSKLGGYLDGIIDRIIEAFLLIGLLLFDLPGFFIYNYWIPSYLPIALLLFFGSVFVSYSRAYASQKEVIVSEKILNWMPGVLERTERLFLIGIGMLLYYVNPVYTTYVIVIAFLLSVITFLQRVFFVVKHGVRR